MKFVSYEEAGEERLGVLSSDEKSVFRVRTSDVQGRPGAALVSVIEGWTANGGEKSIETSSEATPLSEVRLLAPIPRPAKNVFCVGKNYFEHVSEFDNSGFDASRDPANTEAPPYPIFFTKSPTCVIGPDATIDPHTESTSCLDYEAELVVIIGKPGRGIEKSTALEHVWGYTLMNDVTARDLQRDRKQWFLGKSLDTFCPMGPWAVTADELDPSNIDIESSVNGERRQHANTTDLIFDIPTLIADLSRGITLEPGDLIATGTPAGVGVGFTPPRFMSSGDSVSVSATGLGTLVNTVG